MTALDVLMTAKKILSNPKRWTKGSYMNLNSEGDTCYCAIGALRKAGGGTEKPLNRNVSIPSDVAYATAYRRLAKTNNGRWVPGFNDKFNTTHADVMQLFSDAIDAEIAENGAIRAQVPAVTS